MGSFAINMDHVQAYIMPQVYKGFIFKGSSGNSLLSCDSRTPATRASPDNHIISMTADPSSALKRNLYRHTPNGTGNGKSVAESVNGGSTGGMSMSLQDRIKEKQERQKLVLWRRPLTTLHYFLLETWHLCRHYLTRVWHHKKAVVAVLAVVLLYYAIKATPGPHQQVMGRVSMYWVWCGWWLWLGVLSSVGLGTGLHTFLLYLGPHIASVTMAAYTCNSLNFPEPPYPDEIVCPDSVEAAPVLNIWTIMSKVRLEAFMWGAGTALGELPPYFMARGARLSGYDPDDEEMAEFEELQRLKERPEDMSWLDRAKLSVEKLVERVGFFGILACASIPNPLFDLAGITCGHFLVPFWTFFGATLIGKAVIKMHIQKLFVIIAFNEALLTSALDLLASVPLLGPSLHKPFKKFLAGQHSKLKRTPGAAGTEAKDGVNFVSWAFDKFILVMVTYFVVSIVNSLAQSYHKRLSKASGGSASKRKNVPETSAVPAASRPSKAKHAKD
ncbi:vacuole membrane protein 1 isoform X2 [Hyalella azteca]|uniref:Vacuole membrane protein 1 isoform X2 n=1 Tax=Hyalella azteca TaxID=294128 RepID=A0A8B7NTJ4_HYAAZ|nr:vacuole membrane protein 1 isoform X2 [Hyalella azteca]